METLNLARIPVMREGYEPFDFETSLNPKEMKIDSIGIHFEADLLVQGQFSVLAGAMWLHGSLNGTQRCECSRCLDTFNQTFNKQISLNFDTDKKRWLNILPELSEEIQIDSPIHLLCKNNCRGLCPGCGSNLNKSKCVCSTSTAINNEKR